MTASIQLDTGGGQDTLSLLTAVEPLHAGRQAYCSPVEKQSAC
jgi:hypothetical protein